QDRLDFSSSNFFKNPSVQERGEGDSQPMPKVSSLKYYTVAKEEKTRIFLSYKECEEYVKGIPGALYRSFYTKIEAQNFIDQQNIDDDLKDVLNVWTDGYCKQNGLPDAVGSIGVFFGDNDPRNLSEQLPGERQTNNRAEIYAAIRALEICDKMENLIINTDSNYVIISRDVKRPKTNFDLVNRFNDLIKERKGKTYLKHVKGHSGIYRNEKADRLAYLEKLTSNHDDEGHITEYIQIKLSDNQNALLDKECQEFLKQHKFVLDKANNIIEETTEEYLFELLYPEAKLANIKFKN
ncbi:7313_t:CDS:2, partial [Racocetra persica]